jgi:hypothetical protein
MGDPEWFEFDGPLSDSEHAFLAALRQRVEGRLRPWCRRENSPQVGGALIVGIHADGSSSGHVVGQVDRG